jgi:hypothetical protein
LGIAVGRDARVHEEHRAVADALHGGGVVGDEDQGAAAAAELGDAPHALALEGLVADGQHLVQQQHIGLDVRGDRECQPHHHAARVGAHRHVDELLELREGDDPIEPLAHVALGEPVDGAVHEDVLAAREIRVEARPQLQH